MSILWILTAVGAIWLLSRIIGRRSGTTSADSRTTNRSPEDKAVTVQQEHWQVFLQTVEKAKQAEAMGLLEMVPRVYESAQFYPSWIKRGEVPPMVTLAFETRDEKSRVTNLTLNGRRYLLRFTMRPYDLHSDTSSLLEADLEILDEGGRGVFGCSLAQNDAAGPWKGRRVSGFVEGQWLSDFRDVFNYIELHRRRFDDKFLREDTERLKKDFDIS